MSDYCDKLASSDCDPPCGVGETCCSYVDGNGVLYAVCCTSGEFCNLQTGKCEPKPTNACGSLCNETKCCVNASGVGTCCGQGEKCTGSGLCCASGSVCPPCDDANSCISSQCCGIGEACINGSCLKQDPCNGQCSQDETCILGECCPNLRACPNTCCGPASVCLNGICTSSDQCGGGCGSDYCCFDSMVNGELKYDCCSSNEVCLRGGRCCVNGKVCNDACCAEGQICDNGTCCNRGQFAYNGVCCNVGQIYTEKGCVTCQSGYSPCGKTMCCICCCGGECGYYKDRGLCYIYLEPFGIVGCKED